MYVYNVKNIELARNKGFDVETIEYFADSVVYSTENKIATDNKLSYLEEKELGAVFLYESE